MFNRRNTVILLFCLLLVAFGFGLFRLMALRFEAGDVFPPYSSLRSDPLGSKVLYESFGHLSGVDVARNFKALAKLKDSPRSTIFLVGLSPDALDLSLTKKLDALAQQGHRVVITMLPVRGKVHERTENRTASKSPDSEPERPESESDKPKGKKADPVPPILERWGFRFDYVGLFAGKERAFPSAELASESHREELPRQIVQHSELYFAELDERWNVLYRLDDSPVIMECFEGEGSLVLVSDSFLVSSEAMRHERHPAILAWLAGDNNLLVFDETHLGISSQQGVMVLVRQYRLTAFLSALLVLAFLYLWQRSVAFIPIRPVADPDGVEETSVMDYHAGLVNLLKRNVKVNDLLPVCFNEWLKSLPEANRRLSEQTARVRDEVEAAQSLCRREGNISGCYKKIAGILAERKHLWK